MHDFTPLSALLGGSLIGLSASLLMLSHGKVAGISGIFAGALKSPDTRGEGSFRVWFLAGLVLAGIVARVAMPSALPHAGPSLLAGGAAGLLVGFGTRLGSGCTSGHGVCGLSRLSARSLAATVTFIAAGMITVATLRALGALS